MVVRVGIGEPLIHSRHDDDNRSVASINSTTSTAGGKWQWHVQYRRIIIAAVIVLSTVHYLLTTLPSLSFMLDYLGGALIIQNRCSIGCVGYH
jgi:hypothetical protein